MIYKNLDDKTTQIKQLKSLYEKSQSKYQKKYIKDELTKLENGLMAEKDNAYYLDHEYKNRDDAILIHDLRIKHKDRTAQIDHLIISRVGIYLMESKSFKGTLTIN
ncbi:MAG: nuclease-related domain-containing protein, partial [Candidatus Muiribacteriota bacterium]